MLSGRAKYISPYTDFGFRKLFGTEVNKDLLKDFLNELINEKGKIVHLTYLQPEQVGRNEYDRRAVFDIHCETDSGEKFIVEMQCAKQKYFKDRSLYYATFPIQSQALKGEWNYKLSPVYFVGILNFRLDENKKDGWYHREIKLMDTKEKTVFSNKLTFVYMEMPNFNKKEEELETHLDKWLYILKHLPEFETRPSVLHEKIFDKIFSTTEIAALSPEEMLVYEDSLKVSRDNYSILKTSREEGWSMGMEEGKVLGIEEGKVIGIEEGKVLGMEEGKVIGIEEGKNRRNFEIALNLLSLGIPVETISKSTGLLPEEIEALTNVKK